MKKGLFISLVLVAVWVSGCKKEDNVVVPQEEHFAAEGVYLSSSGIPVASISVVNQLIPLRYHLEIQQIT